MILTKHQEAEQRQHIRLELFEYALAYQAGVKEPKQVVVVNLGLGGLQIRSRDAFEIGSRCELELPGLSMMIPVEVKFFDEVTGSDLYAVGMSFKPSTHEERMAIAMYVHGVFQRQCDLLTN
jgi:hypothetical protein